MCEYLWLPAAVQVDGQAVAAVVVASYHPQPFQLRQEMHMQSLSEPAAFQTPLQSVPRLMAAALYLVPSLQQSAAEAVAAMPVPNMLPEPVVQAVAVDIRGQAILEPLEQQVKVMQAEQT